MAVARARTQGRLVAASDAQPAVDEQGHGPAGAALQSAVGVDQDPLPHRPAVQVGREPVAVPPELVGVAPQVGIRH
jgi:hypothetical protein